MTNAKLSLARLENLLLIACDDLRGNMDKDTSQDLLTGKVSVQVNQPEKEST